MAAALEDFRALLAGRPDDAEALQFLGLAAFAEGAFADAAARFRQALDAAADDPGLWFNLATALEMSDDADAAIDAYLQSLARNPNDAMCALFAGAALHKAGRRAEALQTWSLGDDANHMLRQAKDAEGLDPAVRARSQLADDALRGFFTDMHKRAVDAAEAELAASGDAARPDVSRIAGAVWVQTHDAPVSFNTLMQEPTVFYVPALRPVSIADNNEFAWAKPLEARADEIRAEFLNAATAHDYMRPYVPANASAPTWRTLRGSLSWSSMHIFDGAAPTAFTKLFPKTIDALSQADLLRTLGNPVEVFFSVLKPGAHIPPHFGVANNRLTVHLPLIVPENCAIRVGEDIHEWREGELFAFDDSFEHEAWNRGQSDRVVLIFETHHPDLTAAERVAIEHAFDARKAWLNERAFPQAQDQARIQ